MRNKASQSSELVGTQFFGLAEEDTLKIFLIEKFAMA